MAGKKAAPLEVVHPDCAGIDVGKRKHYVAVDPSRFEDPVRNFGTFTGDLEAMAEWLGACGVRQLAMESTGVYWTPVFEVLDRAGFEVHPVNPRATQQVSGRKSDVLDCQWIRQLMNYGLLRGAFRAPDALCPMRSYVRQRGRCKADEATISSSLRGNWRWPATTCCKARARPARHASTPNSMGRPRTGRRTSRPRRHGAPASASCGNGCSGCWGPT